MKRLYFIFAMVTFQILCSNAQSKLFIGGRANINNESTSFGVSDNNEVAANFYPSIGLHLNPRLIIGVKAILARDPKNYILEEFSNFTLFRATTVTKYGAGIFIRKRKPITEKVGIYAQIFVDYYESNIKYNSGDSFLPVEDDRLIDGIKQSKTFGTGLITGIEVKFSKRWMLNAQFGTINFENTVPVNDFVSSAKDIYVNFSMSSLRLSMLYYLK